MDDGAASRLEDLEHLEHLEHLARAGREDCPVVFQSSRAEAGVPAAWSHMTKWLAAKGTMRAHS